MEKNKTGKYLKYAIGEIVLVMIGILLALQVNNWNVKRLNNENEVEILVELLEDAKADATFYTSRLKYLDDQLYTYSMLNTLFVKRNDNPVSNVPYNNVDIYDASLAFQSTLISNFKNRIEDITNNKIKSILREYSLAYHYLELHFAIKDETYDKYVGDLKLKYYKFQQRANEKTTFGAYFEGIDFQENEERIHFIIQTVEASKIRTKYIIKINTKLMKELDTTLKLKND